MRAGALLPGRDKSKTPPCCPFPERARRQCLERAQGGVRQTNNDDAGDVKRQLECVALVGLANEHGKRAAIAENDTPSGTQSVRHLFSRTDL